MTRNGNGVIRPHQTKLAFIYRMADLIIIVVSLFIACWLYDVPWQERYASIALIALIFYIFFAGKYDVYRSWRIAPLRQELGQVWMSWVGAVFAVMFFIFALKTSESYSRAVVLMWLGFVPIGLSVWRILLRNVLWWLRRNGHNTRSVAILGANEYGERLAKTLHGASWMGLNLMGFFDDRSGDRIPNNDNVNLLGNIDELIGLVKSGKVDVVYVSLPLRAEHRVVEIIDRLGDTTATVYYAPDFFAMDLLHSRWFAMGEFPIVSVYETPFYGVDGWLKRLQDIVLGSMILMLALIPMLLVAIGVKLSSPGNVLFKQRRYGMNGQEIEVWKFRSMSVCEDGDNIKQATVCDVRVTPFGAFLRRTSLDELPQLFNVLQGTMSLVGPRPHAVAHNEEYRQLIHRYMLRHKVKPGMTGWAQVNGWRGETDTLDKMEKRVQCDLEYIRNWSLLWDVRIIFSTVFKGFVGKNVY